MHENNWQQRRYYMGLVIPERLGRPSWVRTPKTLKQL